MGTKAQRNTYVQDTELVARTLAGDKTAFEQIITQHKDAVFGIALSIVRNFHEAEDIAQETFIDAFFNLSKLKQHNKLGAWLCDISRIKAQNTLHRRCSKPDQQPIHSFEYIPDSLKGPTDIAEKNEVKSMSITAINLLSPVQRNTVVLYYINNYSQNEIAGFLNIPLVFPWEP